VSAAGAPLRLFFSTGVITMRCHQGAGLAVWTRSAILGAIAFLLFGSMLAIARAQEGKQDETPIGPRWWPSEFGAGDQRGAANRLNPAKVLEANALIKTGKTYSLGRLYEIGMPMPNNTRLYSLTIPGSPTSEATGKNQAVSFDEMVTAQIGQVGTQMDGLAHVGVRVGRDDIFYNGFIRADFARATGMEKLGIENVGPIFTRGVLLDVAGIRKQKRLPVGYAITPQDLQACVDAHHLEIRPGDVVLIHTGHGKLWMKDNQAYNDGEPGIGIAAARWLSEKKITLVGADNWAIECLPSEDPKRPYPVHQWNLVRNGIHNLENLDLGELAADKVYEFAFILAPLRIKGATGSPGNPIAVR
jgi:kynurenine formamidase